MITTLVSVPCPCCRSADSTPYAEENGYSLVRCLQCGLLYVNPRPSGEQVTLSAQTGDHLGERTLRTTGWRRLEAGSLYRDVLHELYGREWFDSDLMWLDIGCGYGEFLQAVRTYSRGRARCFGIEPNRAKRLAAERAGLDVRDLDALRQPGSYDAVSLLNVFSHLPDPAEEFRAVRDMLRPRGEFLLETGDTAGLPPDAHPRPLNLPDHLTFASESTLRQMLSEHGFEVLRVAKRQAISPHPISLAREAVRALRPGRVSRFRLALSPRCRTDMWIRARRTG
jgi:SAM-dependent methyltransferase/Zn ribbon nucleic-acid-binding protein